jgi:hypothetical protein
MGGRGENSGDIEITALARFFTIKADPKFFSLGK